MDQFERLHQIRLEHARRLQPEVDASLSTLLPTVGNPFRSIFLEPDVFGALLNEDLFVEGVNSKALKPKVKYLYQISGLEKTLKRDRIRGKGKFDKEKTADDYFEALLAKTAETSGDWVRLSEIASGVLAGPRSSTWWTCTELSAEDVYNAALRLGIWVSYDYPIVLRVELDSDLSVHLPSEIDALLSRVFYVQSSASARSGRTIDLSRNDKLQLGLREYVLKNVPVEKVSIRLSPQRVPDRHAWQQNQWLDAEQANEEFFKMLVKFHSSRRFSPVEAAKRVS